MRSGCRHGIAHTWHKNGVLASEEPYQNGLPHGVCRRWDEAGRLLGKYRMVHGTGVQRIWHDNGQLQVEVSMVRGQFCGGSRVWLRDGNLISERIYLFGRIVTAKEYRAAAAENPELPRLRGRRGMPLANGRSTQKHIHRVFVAGLLKKRHCCEAQEWLHRAAKHAPAHSLGRFKRQADAAKFVQRLYRAGAVQVIVPDIYRSKAGEEFADGLLVRLPKDQGARKSIRVVCARFRTRRLGAVEPDQDIGESNLYLSMA